MDTHIWFVTGYWLVKILFAKGTCVRTPICLDAATSKPIFDRTFGHFVRVLVDIDLVGQYDERNDKLEGMNSFSPAKLFRKRGLENLLKIE